MKKSKANSINSFVVVDNDNVFNTEIPKMQQTPVHHKENINDTLSFQIEPSDSQSRISKNIDENISGSINLKNQSSDGK